MAKFALMFSLMMSLLYPATTLCQTNTQMRPASTLYIVGESGSVSCIWKDGAPTVLDLSQGDARSITVDRTGSIYIAGSASKSPCYWKDGQIHRLEMRSGDLFGAANDIYVTDEGVVLSVGTIETTAGSRSCLWIDSELQTLPVDSTAAHSEASAICVDPSGIQYIVGTLLYRSGPVYRAEPYLLKDANFTSLFRAGWAASVSVSKSGSVWIAGTLGGYTTEVPCYWKDEQIIRLPLGSGNSRGFCNGIMLYDGENVCAYGQVGNSAIWGMDAIVLLPKPCYWLNGDLTLLPIGKSTSGMVLGAARDNSGTLYFVGQVGTGGETIGSSKGQPCFWKNGELTLLEGRENWRSGKAYGVLVVANGD